MTSKQMTILVMDGSKVSRRVYSQLIKKHFKDCRILEVELGEDGLYFVKTEEISCILIDSLLPDMSSTVFLEKLSAKHSKYFVPVVVIAGEGDETSAVEAMRAGAQDYLVKGRFSQDLLAQAIENAMGHVELHQMLEMKNNDLERINGVLTKEIVQRKRAEESLRLFRDLTNQTVDSLFIVNPVDGTLVDFNSAAYQSLGYLSRDFKKAKVMDFDTKINNIERDLMPHLQGAGQYTYETVFKHVDGTNHPVEVSFRHIRRDDGRYLVGVARDITERKKVEEKLRDLSNRDGLTGVYNRRYLDEKMIEEWGRHKRDKSNLSLIMLDVDYFKRYNDKYGHSKGDECLKQIAECVSEHVKRPADLLARYGGEEFAVILPNTDSEGALHMAQSLCDAVTDLKIPHAASSFEHVSLSVGLTTVIPDEGHTPQQLFDMADRALYEAKEQGRNRVFVQAPVEASS